VPKSRVRKKKDAIYTPPPAPSGRRRRSPRWVGPAVLGLLLLGVTWLTVAYMTSARLPVFSALGNWNVLVGFALIAAGFALATQWH
jgi:hypothetical protein